MRTAYMRECMMRDLMLHPSKTTESSQAGCERNTLQGKKQDGQTGIPGARLGSDKWWPQGAAYTGVELRQATGGRAAKANSASE